jgi:hypothetical protein
MGIEDIQISEKLETNAPSIKYRGDEGPKSPQEMEQMMMAQLEEEYAKYVFEMQEQGIEPMSMQQFIEQAMAEGQMSGGTPLPNDPTKPVNPFQPKPTGPTLPNRQMAAYGGIMGLDGRRKYGLGSSLKKFVRKVIPNEVADIAVKAAPFVAPFNPLLAAGMAGIGGFDQHGSISKGLKSGLMTYGGGQLARGIGGGMGNLQTGFNPAGGFGNASTFGKGFLSNPLQGEGGLSALLNKTKAPVDVGALTSDAGFGSAQDLGADTFSNSMINPGKSIIEKQSKSILGDLPKLVKDNLSKVGLGNNLVTGLLAGGLGASALMGNMTEEEIQDLQRGEGLDIEGIRTEVIEAMKDPSGEALEAIRIKYPFLGKRETKDLSAMAYGGRIRRAEGGLMDLGGMEKDYRAEGGFVPIGREEKADDVPARLSVNEFVFTADAVRNAGGGDIDKGAEVMENMMKHLEQGGQVSDESQGMAGAQQMFETSERLSEVI